MPVLLSGVLGFTTQLQKHDVTQFDISTMLNARSVTTIVSNHLTTWTKGIDGGGQGDGYLTKSAALFNKQDTTHALPDNALFPANGSHPQIQLHYSNRDSVHYQACSLAGEAAISFSVPAAHYSEIYFALTSAEGSSSLKIDLIYTDGSGVNNVLVPDYYQDIPANDQNFCYLAHNLAKWGPDGRMTEKDHHNIDLLKIIPDAKRRLTGIRISKEKAGYLVIWAAAGVKEEVH